MKGGGKGGDQVKEEQKVWGSLTMVCRIREDDEDPRSAGDAIKAGRKKVPTRAPKIRARRLKKSQRGGGEANRLG